MPVLENIENCLLLSSVVDSSFLCNRDLAQLMIFKPIERTAKARPTFGNSANADTPICCNDAQIIS